MFDEIISNTFQKIDTDTLDKKRDFIRVGKSKIQGTGVFAKRKIPKGTRIIEYQGVRQSKIEFINDLNKGLTTATYAFGLGKDVVIDGNREGNNARFINHSCDPNCEVYTFDNKLHIYAIRDIVRGEEVTFDYQLTSVFRNKKENNSTDEYKCNCGSSNCRGSMISTKRSKK